MFTAQSIDMDDAMIVQCKGRLVRSEAALHLRNVVLANRCRSVILDFSELEAVEGGGLGMLAFLHRWTEKNGISMKVLNPSPRVQQRLRHLGKSSNLEFEVECGNILRLVGLPDREHSCASNLAA